MASSGEEKEETQEDENDRNEEGKDDSEVVLDLSGRRLKRLERAPVNQTFATALVLDNNQLQNLANLDSYGELERLSIGNNQIVRMYWFARMYSLRILNLPNNHIVQIEGLRELHHLIHLNLASNNIKNVEGLAYSHKLEHLNLSGNLIVQIGDLSMLKNLKELFMHRNRITSLHRCNKFLPASLFILTLSDNSISDLNELCSLSHLTNLEQFTILNNPCLEALQLVDDSGAPTGPPLGFDYRPYVINWCLNLKVLDGYKVTPKESLKAEWLYSQGKGRGFQVGEHTPLVQYLSGVCLAGGGWGGADLPDDDDKLAKILQLAKQHQQELRHSTINGHDNSDSSSGCGSRGSSHHDSPASRRRSLSRNASLRRNTGPQRPTKPVRDCHRRANSHTPGAPLPTPATGPRHENTSHSYHVELSSTLYGGDLRTPDTPSLMTQSMDPALLAQLSGPDRPQKTPASMHQMSRSLGPEQMARSLDPHHSLSFSVGNTLESHSQENSLMYQSLGPEQLQQSLNSGQDDQWDNRLNCGDYPSRPTKLFCEDTDSASFDADSLEGSHLDGSSQFVPAPESMMSPEFQCSETPSAPAKNAPVPPPYQPSCRVTGIGMTCGSRGSRSGGKPPPAQANARSLSSQRPRTTPVKSPAPDSTKSSPRSQHRQANQAQPITPSTVSAQSSARARQSPKPAPRYSRSSSNSQSTPQNSCKKEIPKSPTSSKVFSEGDSDNTDSEISVSKLQTIKSIAAERKGKDKKSSSSAKASEEGASDSIRRPYSPQHSQVPKSSVNAHVYNPDKYRGSFRLRHDSRGRKSSNSSGGSLGSRSRSRSRTNKMSEVEAAVTLQKHWRGYRTRFKNPVIAKLIGDIRHSRAEQHIRYLSDKLKAAETALERERKLRHLQLDAIRALWREIQKLQTGRKDGVNTPSTPMTPLTPLTPLERAEKSGGGGGSGGGAAGAASKVTTTKVYSEESVKELTEFCTSLQGQVSQLQESLSMVTQVMNAFCNLPGSQSLLTMSQSSGSGMEKSMGEEDIATSTHSQGQGGANVPLSESVAKFTTSIRALTTSIVKSPGGGALPEETEQPQPAEKACPSKIVSCKNECEQPCAAQSLARPSLATSATSLTSNELNSTGNDVSTLSNDSNEAADTSQPEEADLSDSSQSSLSASLSGSPSLGAGNGTTTGSGQHRLTGLQRPSSLPVPRPHTPRTTS